VARPSSYSPELRVRAVRMVAELTPGYPSQYAAITAVAQKLGIGTPAGGDRAAAVRSAARAGTGRQRARSEGNGQRQTGAWIAQIDVE
jgi:hypothetical protein